MTQIMVEVSPETIRQLHDMTALHPNLSISQVAGQLLDAQLKYRLEIERMRVSVETANPPFGGGY